EWLALLSQIMDEAHDPVELAPLRPEGTPVGTMAVRAYAMFRKRRYHDAIELVLKAAVAAPNAPLLDWALAWLEKPDTGTTLNCIKIGARFKAIMDDLPRLRGLADGSAPLLVRIAPLIRQIRGSQIYDSAFLFLAAKLLRAMGEVKEAYEA